MLDTPSILILRFLSVASFFGLASFALVSLFERERRAVVVASALAVATATPLFLASYLPASGRIGVVVIIVALFIAAAICWFLPIGRRLPPNGDPKIRHDERDIMFARGRLRRGTPNYEAYYKMRPQNQRIDDKTRELPGLESPESEKAEPLAFAAGAASSVVTEALGARAEGPVTEEQHTMTPAEWATFIKNATRYFGALHVGITALKPAHIYTHIGRDEGRYGDGIDLDHRFAIAFTVEMDHQMMAAAPEAPVFMESCRQYANAALTAVQVAAMIRKLGFPAQAHIDGRYRIIAPLVARDAGLGDIGRMGLLMTEKLGPRVRLGIITTNVPLEVDEPSNDLAMIDFCSICKKCATNCPTGSISTGERETAGEKTLRWRIDAETCFRYWNVIGTDCGRCMAVCPYSHPDNAAHNLVRWAIRRSGAARRLLLMMDDVFYGKRPENAVRSFTVTDEKPKQRHRE